MERVVPYLPMVVAAVVGFPSAQEVASPTTGWTLDSAFDALRSDPRDPFLQFVVMQLARRSGEEERCALEVGRARSRGRSHGRVDVFDLFSGALAVQESLQLDTMRLGPRAREAATVPVASLAGPAVESHPWADLLAGRAPRVSPISGMVPADFYLIEFRSLNALLSAFERGDVWGVHLLQQTSEEATSQDVADRLRTQLAIETSRLLRPLYDQVVESVGITGSDLYLREGSDVTLLFRLRQPALFRQRMDGFLDAAVRDHEHARRTRGELCGVPFEQVTTPDRVVSVFSAWPAEDQHVRSNSKAALARVLAAIAGRDPAGAPVRRLGDTDELRYVRTLMPFGAPEEDGFVYLSDPFVRRIVGPAVKLTEQRRMWCYNHLRMIGHAALLFRSEHGRFPRSLAELQDAGCTPGRFGDGELACPDGGDYVLGPDGHTATCPVHGHVRFLTPCLEIPVETVGAEEAEGYAEFVRDYERYWRDYFDPIALRLRVTSGAQRIETIVLPLIDNSIYTAMARGLGGPPAPLDALPVPVSGIFSAVVKLRKDALLEGAGDVFGEPPETADGVTRDDLDALVRTGLGDELGFHVCDAEPMFDLSLPRFLGEVAASGAGASVDGETVRISFLIASLNAPVYLSARVTDADVVDRFLAKLDHDLARLARTPTRDWWVELEYDFYHLSVDDLPVRAASVRFGPVAWRMFWARIGDGLYLASRLSTLRELRGAAAPDDRPVGNAMVRLRPEHWAATLGDFQLGWAEGSRRGCLDNLGPLNAVARSLAGGGAEPGPVAAVDALARELYGARFFCPDGGSYALVGGQVGCSVHGTLDAPRQPVEVPESSELGRMLRAFRGMTATLTFEPEGLRAVVTVENR